MGNISEMAPNLYLIKELHKNSLPQWFNYSSQLICNQLLVNTQVELAE